MSTLRSRWGTRDPGAVRGLEAGAAVARLALLVGTVVAAILVLGIALIVIGANRDNEIVGAALDAARWLAGPFDRLFTLDNPKTEVAVNWGIAAVVYYAIARVVARFMVRRA
jgi:hypothetical protein